MSPTRRREVLVATLVAGVAFLPFLRGAVSGASLYFRDLALYFFPLRRLALDGLRAGEVRFWNPYLHEGVPLSLPALGYPVDLLQLLRPDEAGLSLVLALHVPLAALGLYALARRLLRVPPVAAAAGALVYALGGFVLSSVNLYVFVQAAAWAPFVVLLLAHVLASPGPRAVTAAALVTALALSTTGVEIVAQAILVGLVLGWRRGDARRGLAGAGASVGLGFVLAAPVLVPLASQVEGSARSHGFSSDVVLAHSVHPFTLLQTLVGGLYGNLSNLAVEWWGQNFFPRGFPYILSLYLGAATLAVALVGAVTRQPRRRRLLALLFAGLVLSLGRWSGLAALVEALPALGAFRYPVKAFFTVHLAVALLVALGLGRLLDDGERRGWTLLTVSAGVAGGLLGLTPALPHLAPALAEGFSAAFFPPGLAPATRSALLSRVLADAATGGILALALAAVAGLAARGALAGRRSAILVLALLGADLLRTGAGLNPMVTPSFFRPSPELASRLPALRLHDRVFTCPFERSRRYHVARQAHGPDHESWTFAVALETLTPAFNVPLGVQTAMSPDLTMLVPAERVLSPSEAGCRDLDALLPRLRRAGVGTVVSTDRLSHPQLESRGHSEPRRLVPLAVHWYALAQPLPRVQVARTVFPVPDRTTGAARAAEPGFVEAGGTAVEGGEARRGVVGRVEDARFANDSMQITAEASTPTVLVVRDGWAPGWTAEVNGRRAPLRRADGRHRAVPLPAGHSVVVLRYRPPALVPSVVASLLALGGLSALAWRRGLFRLEVG